MNKQRTSESIIAITALLLGLKVMTAVPEVEGVTGIHPKELNQQADRLTVPVGNSEGRKNEQPAGYLHTPPHT